MVFRPITELHLIKSASAEQSENESNLTKLDSLLLHIGAKVMVKNSRTGQTEPKLSVVFWIAIAAVIVLVLVAFFFGQLSGYSNGLEKGKEQSTMEQLRDELKALKEKEAKQKQFDENLKKAQELSEQANKGKK